MPHKRDLIAVAILIALGLTLALPRFRSGLDLRDEGFLAYGAERVMEGQIPNRDFVSLQPPGSFYTAAAVFKLLGTSLASLRILGLAIYLTIPVLIYAILRRMANPAPAFAGAIPAIILGIPYFNFVPFAVWQGIGTSTAAVLFYLWAIDFRRSALALAAGILTGASLLLRQDQAFYVALSIIAYTALLRKTAGTATAKMALYWLAGIALILLPCITLWALCGALPSMFQQLVAAPLTTYAKTSSAPFPVFAAGDSAAQVVLIALFYAIPCVIVLVCLRLWRMVRKEGWTPAHARLAFAIPWSALFYCQALTRSDLSHLLITLVPFFVLCAWAWNSLNLQLTIHVGAALVLAGILFTAYPAVFPQLGDEQKIDLPRGGVSAKSGAQLAAFVRSVQAQVPANRSILCLPYQPILYFLCERRNPTRWNYLWPGDQTPQDHQTLIQEAQHDPPALVLISEEQQFQQYASNIVDYVHNNYKKAAQAGPVSIYLPK